MFVCSPLLFIKSQYLELLLILGRLSLALPLFPPPAFLIDFVLRLLLVLAEAEEEDVCLLIPPPPIVEMLYELLVTD